MSEGNGQPLPPGWTTAVVGNIMKVRNGFAFSTSEYRPAGVPLIRQSDLGESAVSILHAKRVDKRFLDELPGFIVRKGDLLIGMSGSLGKIAKYQEPEPSLQNQRTGLLLLNSHTDAGFAKLVMQYVERQIVSGGKGIAVQNVSATQIEACRFPLAPLREQERISSVVEELFSDLDAAVAALGRVQAKLKHYRAAVLKAAVEGSLTAEWREKHPATELASTLLTRILAERRRRWEAAQLQKFKEAGKEPPANWRTRYKGPVQPETHALTVLPTSWVWASFDQVGETQGGLQKSPARTPLKNHYPYLRVANVHRGALDLDELHRFELTQAELDRLRLETGDLLIVEGNGSRTEIGRCAMWRGEIPDCVHQNHIIRVRPLAVANPKYLGLFMNSPIGQKAIQWVASSTSGLYTLSVAKIEKLPLALPPTDEQDAIVEAVEDQLSVIDHLETDLEAKLKSAQALRQSILRHAFTGQLVPQDPTDEPAAELLKRILADRNKRLSAEQSTRKTSPRTQKPVRKQRTKGQSRHANT